jgi:hypothetical protein
LTGWNYTKSVSRLKLKPGGGIFMSRGKRIGKLQAEAQNPSHTFIVIARKKLSKKR